MRWVIDTMANPKTRIFPEKKQGCLLWSLMQRSRISPRSMCGLLMLIVDSPNPLRMASPLTAKHSRPINRASLQPNVARVFFPAIGSTERRIQAKLRGAKRMLRMIAETLPRKKMPICPPYSGASSWTINLGSSG